jgi:hypothetical protein
MSPRETEDVLVEAALTAYRERDAEGLPLVPPEWWDLSPEGRENVYRRQLEARRVESLLDERGWSATVKAVLARIR